MAAASDHNDASAAAGLIPGLWTAFVKLLDIPMRGLQALIGQRNMPYMFLLPNLAFFGIFVFIPLAINVWYSVTGGAALFLGQRPYVGSEQYAYLFDCGSYFDPSSCREDHFWRGVRNTLARNNPKLPTANTKGTANNRMWATLPRRGRP